MIGVRLCALCSLCIFAGCAPTLTREAPPVTTIVTQKCVAEADIPKVPPRAMPKAGTVDQLAAGAGSDLLALDAYARQADAVLKQCAKE